MPTETEMTERDVREWEKQREQPKAKSRVEASVELYKQPNSIHNHNSHVCGNCIHHHHHHLSATIFSRI